ncbi:class I SAM-dependent methyltransferase [Aliterella atlantica]|uniref:SAM-dependent methlyltransferase n=1 Tax=Aliterella atlantica CENA595 TaxID=1618023 RepID=A0A0D8ZSN6_9CYAN|nr:class I SAM-dependent methyltransferase [Aliterella atlantica]KJH71773.1 SAM-dependent methlyltransferase [Aliterella atlantica CENA595]
MATILRAWSYRYQWLYDAISRLAAISVGGEAKFRQLALQGLAIAPDTKILDLCCASGQTTGFLVQRSPNVTGLDASPRSLERARKNVPQAEYIEAFAESMPFADNSFDLVHTSVALHEMQPEQLRSIIKEVCRVLKPDGVFTLIDFHKPTNWLYKPGISLFLLLFETQTAWQLLQTDLVEVLTQAGFKKCDRSFFAGGSLQVIQAYK